MTILAEIEAGCDGTDDTATLEQMSCDPKSTVALARPSIAQVLRVVAAHYDLTVDDILSRKSRHRYARPRQMAMYIARQVTGRSLPVIAKNIGQRHHTTVFYAARVTEQRIADRSSVATDYREIMDRLHAQPPAAVHANVPDPFHGAAA